MNIDGGATTSHQDQSEEAPGVEDTDETEEDNPVPVPVPVEIGTDMADECQDLLDWICEIMDAVVVNVVSRGFFLITIFEETRDIARHAVLLVGLLNRSSEHRCEKQLPAS